MNRFFGSLHMLAFAWEDDAQKDAAVELPAITYSSKAPKTVFNIGPRHLLVCAWGT